MPLTQVEEKRLAEYRKAQEGGAEPPPEVPEPARPRRQQELDLTYARLSLGVDLLAFVALEHKSETSRTLALEMAQPDEGSELDSLRLDAMRRAIASLRHDQWMYTLVSRMHSVASDIVDPDEHYVCLRRPDLDQWLPGGIEGLPIVGQSPHVLPGMTRRALLPHSAVVGWWPESPDPSSLGFYIAAWLHESYEIVYPIDDIAQHVHSFLTLFAFPTTAPDTPRFGAEFERGEYQQLDLEHRCYPLRGRRKWVFNARTKRLYMQGLGRVYVGEGLDEPTARANLTEKIDQDFRALFGTRPPHRNDQQEKVWKLLCRVIDLDEYRDRQPFRATRVGRIWRVSADARVVGWEDERGSERILLKNAPPEFAEIPKGGRFEATILYHAGADQLPEMDLPRIEGLRLLREVDGERVAAFWKRLARRGTDAETGK